MGELIVTLVNDTSNTGKKIRTEEITVGSNVVEQQVVTLADSDGNLLDGTTTYGLTVKPQQATATTGNLTAQNVGISGSMAAGSTLSVSTVNCTRVAVQVTGTYAGTFAFDGSNDGGNNFNPLLATRSDGSAAEISSGALSSLTRLWLVDVAGLTSFRFRCSAYTSGSAAVTLVPIAAGAGGGSLRNVVSKPVAGSPIQNLDATPVAIKASAGTLYGCIVENNQGAESFVQLFDETTGSVTLGTTKPDLEVIVPANSMSFVPLPTVGWPFGNALTVAATTASGGATGSANGVSLYPVFA